MGDLGIGKSHEHLEFWFNHQGNDMASQSNASEERKWWQDYFRLRVWAVVAILLVGAKPVWPIQYLAPFVGFLLVPWLPRGNVALRGWATFMLPIVSFFIYPRGDGAQGTLWVVRWMLPVVVVVELVYWIVLCFRRIRQ